MTEDPTRKDVREINYKIDDVEKSIGILLRSRKDEVIKDLMENCFKKSIEKVRVFLSIDGVSSVNEISAKLGIKPQNISRHMTDLVENDLIRIKTTDGPKVIYEKTSQVKKIRLEKFLLEYYKEELAEKKQAE